MVVFLAKETGWSIEYIMSLTMKQLRLIFSGFSDLTQKSEQGRTSSGGIKSDGARASVDNLGMMELMLSQRDKRGKSLFNLTDKAKAALKKIYDNRTKKMKADKDA
jgi:hypothetical protein